MTVGMLCSWCPVGIETACSSSLTYHLEKGLSLTGTLLYRPGRLAAELSESVSPMLGLQAPAAMPSFYIVAGDSNSGPSACRANVLNLLH